MKYETLLSKDRLDKYFKNKILLVFLYKNFEYSIYYI
jgi:hypothetical protein